MTTALIRRPGPRLADGLLTHIERRPINTELAYAQWLTYCEALRSHGWRTVEVAPSDECPDAVFIEDALVVFDDLAVVTRPGALARRGETVGAHTSAEALGLPIATILDPGTLDGGDVLKIGRDVYVGVGGRTNPVGVTQLTELLEPRGWKVHPVPITKVLHLKSAVTALPDGTVIGFADLVDDADVFPAFLPVPEPEGAHVVLLGGNNLLMSADAPRTAELFRTLGYEPVMVDISEFEKLEGCVTCLSVRLRTTSTPLKSTPSNEPITTL